VSLIWLIQFLANEAIPDSWTPYAAPVALIHATGDKASNH